MKHLRLVLALSAAAALAPATTRADDDPMTRCIAANDKGVDLRKQGKLIEARAALAICAAPACGADISALCQKRLVDIGARIPSIVFLPKDAANNDVVGVKIRLDGGEPQPLDGRAIAMDPGAHDVVFEAPGQPPLPRSFVLAEGARDRQERIVLGPVAPAPTQGTTSGTPPAAPSSGGSLRTIGFVVGGVGLAGIAAGSVLGLMAKSKWSASQSDCASATSCAQYTTAVSEHDTAATEGNVSTIAFIVGGAALATGIALVLLAPHEPSSNRGGMLLLPSVGAGSCGISLTGGFR